MMLSKLAVRNMRRSARDYLVYLFTMTVVAALMYAFNSLIFQNGLEGMAAMEVDVMAVMIGLATFFIVLIVAWLINYMVRFMLEKRSREFGIYLLLGMKKRSISRLYLRENMLLGGLALLAGTALGVLLSQVLMAVMYAMLQMEYHLHISFHKWTLLMTFLCYAGCYLLALLRCGRKFRKMNIRSLMEADRRNEEIKEKNEEAKRILLPLSVLFLFLFWGLFGRLSGTEQVLGFLVGLVLTIYLFYVGLSAWIICYVRKKGEGIYRGQNLFLLRQFAAKVHTMQFTMGTLTALFTLALLGASSALLLSAYENSVLDDKFPFDVQLFSGNTEEDFARERAVLEEQTQVVDWVSYQIYTDGDDQAVLWVLTHLREWRELCLEEDGSVNLSGVSEVLEGGTYYYPCDTYMGLSDYNRLRRMLGYEERTLGGEEYLVQTKERLREEMQGIGEDLKLRGASGEGWLSFAGLCTDPFSQDGHNGADFCLIVPDAVLGRMKPYYSELAVDISGEVLPDLQERLEGAGGQDGGRLDWLDGQGLRGGSDNIVMYLSTALVRDNAVHRVKYLLGSVIIPLFYIGLVFVCVAVTVLSVQQLSDSAKYRFRYDVLSKLGLDRTQIRRLILKQLTAYYLCPALLAVVISGKMVLFLGRVFTVQTGAATGGFFLKSIALFFGIYFIYFAVTYIGFRRNVEQRVHKSV